MTSNQPMTSRQAMKQDVSNGWDNVHNREHLYTRRERDAMNDVSTDKYQRIETEMRQIAANGKPLSRGLNIFNFN